MIKASLRNKANILIDSGAYSAWRGGSEISLYNYIEFLLGNQSWIGPYFNLDVIDKIDPDAGAEVSWRNYRNMVSAGLKPIPVFHIGEDIRWLHRYLDSGCDYISLGGTVGQPIPEVNQWYKGVWAHLVNGDGLPVVKVHSLGNGKYNSLKMFPWQSGDSTSWIYTAQRTARITLDGKRQVSARHDKLHSTSTPDIDHLDGLDNDVFNTALAKYRIRREAIEERGKVSHFMRTWITAAYYMEVQERVRALAPIRYYPEGLFNSYAGRGKQPAKLDPFRLYLVGGTNNAAYIILAALGHPNVLASYHYIAMSHSADSATHGVSVPLEQYARDPKQALADVPQWQTYRELVEKYTY